MKKIFKITLAIVFLIIIFGKVNTLVEGFAETGGAFIIFIIIIILLICIGLTPILYTLFGNKTLSPSFYLTFILEEEHTAEQIQSIISDSDIHINDVEAGNIEIININTPFLRKVRYKINLKETEEKLDKKQLIKEITSKVEKKMRDS